MGPVTNRSRASRTLETGEATLWVLLIGINRYQDQHFPSLACSALDCQGLEEAIAYATQRVPHKVLLVHHDAAGPDRQNTSAKLPKLALVRSSLQQIVAEAQPQDLVLVYFSGHSRLDDSSQQAVLCLTDTSRDHLLTTGLAIEELLERLRGCAAQHQMLCLDARSSRDSDSGVVPEAAEPVADPMPQLLAALQRQVAQRPGFYSLLSCDRQQRSWEFPELGHSLFAYCLIQGLLGGAADDQGAIAAEALSRYVYYQTLLYIDKTNQQLRLINQQKQERGDLPLLPEYSPQTPRRIGTGDEFIFGILPEAVPPADPRQACVLEGVANSLAISTLSKVLRSEGHFKLTYFPQPGKNWTGVWEAIQLCLQSHRATGTGAATQPASIALLYLRGHLEQTATGDALLVLRNQVKISRSWLRQELRRSTVARQIIILDCPGSTELAEWVEDFQFDRRRGQCLIAAAAPEADPDALSTLLLDTLFAADPQAGLPLAEWIAQIQARLTETQIESYVWISGSQGHSEILPSALAQAAEPAAAFELGVCPYMGLRAFSEDDAPFFFGREALTQQLIEAVESRSFLAVIGASGSGKSSLVQAGLVAQLRQGKQLPGTHQWWMRRLSPGSRPLDALVQRLIDSGTEEERQQQLQQLQRLLHQGVEGLVQWLRSRREPMLVLVVDQLEELFTLAAAEERQRFLELLLGAVEYAGDRFKLVITLRSDFVSACLDYPALAQAVQQSHILVPSVLNPEQYRQIILQPAEKVGLTIEPALLETLLQELPHLTDALPLLAFALEQLWQHRQAGALTLQHYQQHLGNLSSALDHHAQTHYTSLDQEAQSCARWIFLSLTQLGSGTEDIRRRVNRAELLVNSYPAALIDRTLQALTAAKLVVVATERTLPQRASSARLVSSSTSLHPAAAVMVTVEVAHESLIRHWSTLRRWLEENQTRLRLLRQLEQAAIDWQQQGQRSDFLLQGVQLEAAAEIYAAPAQELSPAVQQLIEASLQAQERAQQRTSRRLKRARLAIGLMAALGIVAAGCGGLAYFQRQRAMLDQLTTLNALSESQFLANHQLEALITALRAGHQLQQTSWIGLNRNPLDSIQAQTLATLQQAVEETQERNRLLGHQQPVNGVSVSPNGRWIASGSDDATVRLWQPDGTPVNTFHVLERVTDVAFSPDSQTLAIATADGNITLLNPMDGKIRLTLSVGDWITRISFSPNGLFVAAASRDRTIKIWSASNGNLLRTLVGHEKWVNDISFSPDNRMLVSAGEDNVIKLWDVVKGSLIRTLPGHWERVTSVALSSDGKTLASAGDDRTIHLWNLLNDSVVTLDGHTDRINHVRFSADGQFLVSAGADTTLKLWQATNGELLKTLRGHTAQVLDAAFSPDGKQVISASADTSVRVWAIPNRVLPGSGAYTLSAATNGLIASAGINGKIQLWYKNNIPLGTPTRTLEGHKLPVFTVRFSNSGMMLASGGDDKTIKLWNPNNGTLLKTLLGHQQRITSLSFSTDGSLLASGSEDQTIHIWNAIDGSLIRLLEGHEDNVSSLAFSPAENLLASGSYDNTIKFWRPDGTLLRTLKGHELGITAIAFSPDGETLASASWDNSIKLWRVSDGALLSTLIGHQDGVLSLAFSPDGKSLASGSTDQTIKLWNPADGTLIKTLLGQYDAIYGLGFSPDGTALISAGEVTGIQVWDLDLDSLLKQGCDRLHDYLKAHPEIAKSNPQLCRRR